MTASSTGFYDDDNLEDINGHQNQNQNQSIGSILPNKNRHQHPVTTTKSIPNSGKKNHNNFTNFLRYPNNIITGKFIQINVIIV